MALGTLGAFDITTAISKVVSLSSITGTTTLTILAVALSQPWHYVIFATLAGGYVILRHRTHIQRILAGEEPKLGHKLSESA